MTRIPFVADGVLQVAAGREAAAVVVGTPAWFAWLTNARSFYYESPTGTFTAHHEHRTRGGQYWIAYRRQAGVLRRIHLGKPSQLTAQRLADAALALSHCSDHP